MFLIIVCCVLCRWLLGEVSVWMVGVFFSVGVIVYCVVVLGYRCRVVSSCSVLW